MADDVIAIDEDVIENVVRTFYGRTRLDPLLGPIFDQHIRDWEPHLQKMFAFWSSVMLHSRRYDGRPMPKHVALPIDATYFDRWLKIFKSTVDDICVPEDANLFMKKSNQIAHSLELGVAYTHGVLLKPGEHYISNQTDKTNVS